LVEQGEKHDDLRSELVALIRKIEMCVGNEEESGALIELIERLSPDPNISDYLFWSAMTPEEIVDKVLAYRPILL